MNLSYMYCEKKEKKNETKESNEDRELEFTENYLWQSLNAFLKFLLMRFKCIIFRTNFKKVFQKGKLSRFISH